MFKSSSAKKGNYDSPKEIKSILTKIYDTEKSHRQGKYSQTTGITARQENIDDAPRELRGGSRLYPKEELRLRWQATNGKQLYYDFSLLNISAKGLAFHINRDKDVNQYLMNTDSFASNIKENVIILLLYKQLSVPISTLDIRHISEGKQKFAGCEVGMNPAAKKKLKELLKGITLMSGVQRPYKSLNNNSKNGLLLFELSHNFSQSY